MRTGFRLDDAGQVTQADRYGRPFDTETFGTNGDTVANPEIHLRWAVARGSTAELGLEWRAYLPIENGSSFGMMFGLPITLRAGSLRIDTGLYVPIIFTNQTETVVSVPIHLWIQATRTLWLGPLFGLQVYSNGGGDGTRSASGSARRSPTSSTCGPGFCSPTSARTKRRAPSAPASRCSSASADRCTALSARAPGRAPRAAAA